MQGTSQTADLLHPTADERREVAARLRETNLTEYAEEVERSEGLSKVAAARFVAIPNLIGALNFDKPIVSAKELTDRLADLIEPEPERTCERTWEHSGPLFDSFKCSECLYEFFEPRCVQGYNDLVTNYCPSCGAKVVE